MELKLAEVLPKGPFMVKYYIIVIEYWDIFG